MRLIFFVLMLCLPNFARAEEGWTLGAVAIYESSPRDSLTLVPLVRYDQGPWIFGGRALVTYSFGEERGMSGAAGLGFDFGQDDDGAPEVDLAPTAFASLAYRARFFEVSSSLVQRLAERQGRQLTLDLASGYPLSDQTFLAASLGVTYGDSDWREQFYSLGTAGQISTDLSILSITSLTSQTTVLLGVEISDLASDITSQSFVNTGQALSLTLGVSYQL